MLEIFTAAKRRREAEERAAELQRMADEWRRHNAERRAETERLIALEREQLRQQEEQKRLAKEQERQAVVLSKHEKRIADLEYKVRKLDRDIKSQKELLGDYYAQLDWLEMQQSGTVPGGKEFAKYQDKIVTKQNQIRKAENKLADMTDAKERAKEEMEVA